MTVPPWSFPVHHSSCYPTLLQSCCWLYRKINRQKCTRRHILATSPFWSRLNLCLNQVYQLRSWHEPATRPSYELDESNPHPYVLFLKPILILSFNLLVDLPSVFSAVEILHALVSHACYLPSPPIHFDLSSDVWQRGVQIVRDLSVLWPRYLYLSVRASRLLR
jgi:hypothetical protein